MAGGRGRTNGAPPNSPPLLPRFHVERPHLWDVLDQSADVPVTAVIAPAGSGKTVLLSSWVRSRCPDAVWVTCDDWTKEQFWIEVVHALRRARPDRWLDAADLASEARVDLHALLAAVIADLPEPSSPLVLVLDDLHRVEYVGPLIERLAGTLQSPSRILIGSRSETPIGVSRMRTQALLREVRERDLRLSEDDTASLLERLGARVPEGVASSLAARTEGWAAGIQVAGIALRTAGDPDGFVGSFSGAAHAVNDVLLREVIDRLDPATRSFVRATSVLESLTPGPCEAITGVVDAARAIRDLHAAGLFVVAGDRPGTYRYHSLFKDVLLEELRTSSPESERDAHLRAGNWYATNGPIDLAIAHFRQANDRPRALALFNEHLTAEFARDGIVAPQRFVQALTGGSVRVPVEFLVPVAWTLSVAGAVDQAQVWIERADRQLDDMEKPDIDRLVICRVLTSLLTGDADAAARLLSGLTEPSDTDPVVRTRLLHSAYLRLWDGDTAATRDLLAELTRGQQDPFLAEVIIGGALSWAACTEGHLREADKLAARAIATATAEDALDHPDLVDALRTRGRVLFERGDATEAEAHLERSLRIGERARPPLAFLSGLELARVWLSQGRINDAKMAVGSSRELLADPSGALRILADECDAHIALVNGDTSPARAMLDSLADPVRRALLEARVAITDGRPADARALLEAARPGTLRGTLDVAALRARAAHDCGSDDADSFLRECMTLARDEGLAGIFVGHDLRPLTVRLRAVIAGEKLDGFSRDVLNLTERAVPPARNGAGPSVDPLTQREITVLRYLASRYTVAEIAAELFVSVNTLKTHSKAVYRKLGVSSRREAITEAQRLGIL